MNENGRPTYSEIVGRDEGNSTSETSPAAIRILRPDACTTTVNTRVPGVAAVRNK
jgi:hypothetical protein